MSAVVYDATLGALLLRQIRSTSYEPNVQHRTARAAAALAPAEIGVLGSRPQVTISSGDLDSIITNLSMTGGLYINAGTIIVPFINRIEGGSFKGATAHTTLSGTKGLLLPNSFSARQGDEDGAGCDLILHMLSTDGELSPVTVNINQTLIASAFVAQYEFGPVSVNGVQVNKAISVAVNPGLAALIEIFDGDHHPQLAFIDAENIEPTIQIGFASIDDLNTFGPLAVAMTSAKVNLRNRIDGGTTHPDASLKHIQFTFAGGLSVLDSASGERGQSGEVSITLRGKTLTAARNVAVSL